jgi:hypothetical protein
MGSSAETSGVQVTEFELTHDELKKYEGQLNKVDEIGQDYLNKLYDEYTEHIRENVIIPFCQKFDLRFTAGMGSWTFVIDYEGQDHGKIWFVGEDRRPLPGRPDTVEGEEDDWFEEVTHEEKFLKILLDSGTAWSRSCIGSLVRDYPDKDGK